MNPFRRIVTASALSLTACAALLITPLGAGQGAAAPAVSRSVSVAIPSQWLFFADPFPFGVENIVVTRTAPGTLRFSLSDRCITSADIARRAPYPTCAGTLDVPANVAWVNLSTGATGTLAVTSAVGPGPEPVYVARTGEGLIAIGGALQTFGTPGVATIRA
ncbi:hypothetical protein [Williamsia sp. M5A3_1d]